MSLEPAARLVAVPAQAGGPVALEMRVAGTLDNHGLPARRFRVLAVSGDDARDVAQVIAPATTVEDWQVVRADVVLRPGEAIAIEAIDPITVQSVLGFVPGVVPAGWRLADETPDAVVLERAP
jgi:hypothetical protein